MTNDLPEIQERDSLPSPAPPPGGPRLSDVWVYNGRAYDLRLDCQASRRRLLHRANQEPRHHRHRRVPPSRSGQGQANPAAALRLRPRCNAAGHPPEAQRAGVPFRRRLCSWRHTPLSIPQPRRSAAPRQGPTQRAALAARIKRLDTYFNIVVVLLVAAYFAVQARQLADPVDATAALRDCDGSAAGSLAGFGHYALHRAQRG